MLRFLGSPLRIKNSGNLTGRRFKMDRKTIVKNLPKILLGGFIFVLVVIAWYSKDLPTPNRIKNRTQVASTEIYDRNGELIFAFSGEKKRLPVTLEQIPDFVEQATIALEDKHFYEHAGLDFKGILRGIVLKPITGKGVQGGSTITQQYVKNALLSQKRTISRKIKEAILAVEMEVLYSKDQLLEFYLNEIPYGTNAYGIEAAARTYFAKPSSELTLAEAASLVALPQAPTYYSPYGSHKDDLLRRKNFVLDQMVKEEFLSEQEADEAKKQELTFSPRRDAIAAPHFVFYVKEKLVEKYGERVVEEGGLKVTTTLDLEAQKQAEEAIEAGAKNLDRRGANNAALAAVDTKTGQILAMVGSADYFNDEIQGQVNVTVASRQPGSSFKPVVYATSFKDKYNPAFVLYDLKTDFGGGYNPDNYNGQTHGPVTIRQALANSLNIPAVKTLALVGLPDALKTARDLGITTLTGPDRYGLSLVLGGGEVKPLEMAGAFAAFGNEGKFNQVTPFLKIEDKKGKTLEEFTQPENKQAIDAQIAYQINHILADAGARQLTFGFTNVLNVGGHQAAAKTGTTQEFRDAWTIGYTRQISTAVWVGNTDNTKMRDGSAGAVVAAPIWNKFMNSYHKGKPSEDFPVPHGIQEVTVDKLSNKLPSEFSPEIITDIFASWQVPTEKDDVHVRVKVNKLNGKLATEHTPSELIEERLYTKPRSERPNNPNWENPVQQWAKDNGLDNQPPTEKDDQYDRADKRPVAVITKPADGATISGDLVIEASASAHYGVREVQFFVDGVQVGSDVSAPYSLTYSSGNLTSGEHRVKITVLDQNGGGGSAEIKISVPQTGPVITNVKVSGVSSNSATITWTTSKPSSSMVEYGISQAYGSSSLEDLNLKTSHIVSLGGLQSKTTYYLRVISKDSEGSKSLSGNVIFTTQ